MTTFAVNTRALHNAAEAAGDEIASLDQASSTLSAVSPGNPQFALSATIAGLAQSWQEGMAGSSAEVADLSDRLHGTAKAYEQTEENNVEQSTIVTHATGRAAAS